MFVSRNEPEVMLNQLELGATGTIMVMLCSMWDVNSSTGRYLSTDFIVSDKEFDGDTNVRKSFIKSKGFNRYPFQLVEIDDLEPTNNKFLVAAAGYVTNVGRTTQQRTGSRTLDFYLANRMCQQIRVTLWGAQGDKLIEKRTCHVGLYPIVITAVSVKLYNSNSCYVLTFSHSGLELTKEVLPGDNALPKPGTLENLLMWARNKIYDTSTFHCEVKIDKIRTKKCWNFSSRRGEKCKKGNIACKAGQFWCDSCDSAVEYPVLKYRLELEVSDDTAKTVVVMFDETATSLLKCSAASMVTSQTQVYFCSLYNLSNTHIDLRLPDEEEHSGLPITLANIVGTSHTLELKSHTYYEHGNYESFTCWRVVTDDVVEESSNSRMVAAKADSKAPMVKRLKQRPVEELEDSDAEESFVAESQPKGEDMGCSSDTRKKKRRLGVSNLSSAGEDMNSGSNHVDRPLLSNILHTSVIVHSNTIIRWDGNIQSFCGLKLSDIRISNTGTSSAPAKGSAHIKRKATVNTLDRPFPQTAPRTTARKARKPAALSLAGIEVSYHSLGAPSYECHGCNATMWYEERNNKGNRIANPTFSLCCQKGKVLLPRFNETPEPLKRLLDYIQSATSRFRDQIRVYNGMFCFTSFGARIDHSINVGRGLYTFRINRQNYHRYVSLLPKEGTQPRDWFHSHTSLNMELRLLSERTSSRQYNTPTVAEVSSLITNDFGYEDPTRDIIVNTKDGRPKRISELHPSYMALQYPLLFPYGEDGYHDQIPYHRNTGLHKTKRGYVTMKEYYAYVIQYRQREPLYLEEGGYSSIVYVIEFQKRGLPHAHILLWLEDHCKCKTPGDINDIISAELPSPMNDPAGYKAVTDYMLLGPCGKDARYAACPDRATIVIQENVTNGQGVTPEKFTVVDEIKNYLNYRYLAQCEAVWCMLSFDIHYSYPSVMKLNSHLPNQQPVTLRDSESLPALLEREGGTGKTFLYKTIITRLRSERKIVLSVASSGIASLLLPAGRTAHSRFVIPLELLENSTCGIKQNTHLVELMQEVELIIWDEAPMTQKYAFEALDKTLRDILGYPAPANRNKIFGGLTVLLGGGFRQILLVIPKGKRSDIIQTCINHSELWKHYKVFTLIRSMRVNEYYANGELDTRKQDFNQWVLAIGDSKLPAKIKDREDEAT
ncbi:ATP-dependent DNA helicase PIF1-like protein [Tanacetum coccineum]